MQEVIILFGPMGTGKSDYARTIAKKNSYELMDFDETFSHMFGNKFEPFFNYVLTRIRKSKKTVVIDGWFAWDENEMHSVKLLGKINNIKVNWIHVFTSEWMTKKRYYEKTDKDPMEARRLIELSIERASPSNVKYECTFIDSTDFKYNKCRYDDYLLRFYDMPDADTEAKLLKDIGDAERYQNIKLPSGKTTGGYTDCEKSWEQIKELVDWKGKNVLDVGCHWGYFCHKIKNASARSMTGIDVSEKTIGIAKRIRDILNSNVVLKKQDIEMKELTSHYDVILLLNTLHHLRSPFHVLRRIFRHSDETVIEFELPHNNLSNQIPIVEMGDPIRLSNGKMGGHLRFNKSMLIRFASENGHFLKKEVESRRPNRTIMLFGRSE